MDGANRWCSHLFITTCSYLVLVRQVTTSAVRHSPEISQVNLRAKFKYCGFFNNHGLQKSDILSARVSNSLDVPSCVKWLCDKQIFKVALSLSWCYKHRFDQEFHNLTWNRFGTQYIVPPLNVVLFYSVRVSWFGFSGLCASCCQCGSFTRTENGFVLVAGSGLRLLSNQSGVADVQQSSAWLPLTGIFQQGDGDSTLLAILSPSASPHS